MHILLLSLRGFERFFTVIGDKWLDDLQEFIHVKLLRLFVLALGAWLLVWLLRLVTSRMVSLAERHVDGPSRVSQVRTLSSVIRATGIGAIAFLATLEALDALGINLAPLLASAGVAGIAVGFAAQTIVKDMLNGALILIEDQFNVSDVVTLAGITGTVEAMSLRRTMVRGFDGTLYVIPNSQITNVANQSRDFSTTNLSVSVDFSAPPDQVIALLRQIALGVRNDPAYRDIFLADPEVFGVDAVKGPEVIYLLQVRTLARQQFAAVREMLRRIRLGLEEHNMLPGSPYRVRGAAGAAGEAALEPVRPDPTANPPNETNPFGQP